MPFPAPLRGVGAHAKKVDPTTHGPSQPARGEPRFYFLGLELLSRSTTYTQTLHFSFLPPPKKEMKRRIKRRPSRPVPCPVTARPQPHSPAAPPRLPATGCGEITRRPARPAGSGSRKSPYIDTHRLP